MKGSERIQKIRRDRDSNLSRGWRHDWGRRWCYYQLFEALGKGMGNGLTEIGQKTASLLPGLISSIVSFLFKTAGQAIGFLAEYAWLLILAVVAILVERYVKKNG